MAALDTEGTWFAGKPPPAATPICLAPVSPAAPPADAFAVLAAVAGRPRSRTLTEAFNVGKLNKEFFTDYRNVFRRVVADILPPTRVDAARAEANADALEPALVPFFVQRKGWLNRQRDYLFRNFQRTRGETPRRTHVSPAVPKTPFH